MVLPPKSLRIAINALSKKLLEFPDAQVRIKAARSLGELSSEKAIPALCQALNEENDINVLLEIMDAIVLINSQTSTKPMSDIPKVQMNFNAPVTGVAGNVEGDMMVNPPVKTPAESAQEIQALLKKLQQSEPTATETELVRQVIHNNPTLKARLMNALKQGGTEALKVFFPFVSIPLETIRGFLEAE